MAFDFNPPDGLMNTTSFPTNPASEAAARQQFQTLFDQLKDYINQMELEQNPVGTVIINKTGVNPGTYLGGTWVNIAQGKSLVGVDPNDSDFNAADKSGGSKTQAHGLTAAGAAIGVEGGTQMIIRRNNMSFSGDVYAALNFTGGSHASGFATQLLGSTDSASNMSPYVTRYFWERTA